MAKNYWYNKGKRVVHDNDGDKENLAHEESDDSKTIVYMTTVSDDQIEFKTCFLEIGYFNHMTGHIRLG